MSLYARLNAMKKKLAVSPPNTASGVPLSQQLLTKMGSTANPSKNSHVYAAMRKGGVPKTPELLRILGLPRRQLPQVDLTAEFARPGGSLVLRPIQSAALSEARLAGGLVGAIGVGHGKELLSLLLPAALDSKKAVLLVPPSLREQVKRNMLDTWAVHFKVPVDVIHVVAYSQLSSATQADVLDKIKPDLVIADEAHFLRYRTSARTKRFMRYFEENPTTRFCALSGTITSRSIRDYAHLVELALHERSPLPSSWRELECWSLALDVEAEDDRFPPGALTLFQKDETEPVRVAFRRRCTETEGWVATPEGALGTSLEIIAHSPKLPSVVQDALVDLTDTWTRPDGEELEDVLAFARCARQLSQGFYYRWVWPTGKPDTEWLEARAAWHRAVRSYLGHSSREGLDSPLLLANAARRYWAKRQKRCDCAPENVDHKACVLRSEGPTWDAEAWPAWAKVKDRPTPPTEAVWLSDFVLEEAAALTDKSGPMIWWVEFDAVGRRVAHLFGDAVPYFGPDSEVEIGVESVRPELRTIAASIKSHGTGRNLQRWERALVLSAPASGTTWEQLLGRQHRPGTQADVVQAYVLQHTKALRDAFAQATADARYVESTTGSQQKLLYSTRVGF